MAMSPGIRGPAVPVAGSVAFGLFGAPADMAATKASLTDGTDNRDGGAMRVWMPTATEP